MMRFMRLNKQRPSWRTNIASAKREVSQAANQMVAKIREREHENITALENTRVARADKVKLHKETCSVLG